MCGWGGPATSSQTRGRGRRLRRAHRGRLRGAGEGVGARGDEGREPRSKGGWWLRSFNRTGPFTARWTTTSKRPPPMRALTEGCLSSRDRLHSYAGACETCTSFLLGLAPGACVAASQRSYFNAEVPVGAKKPCTPTPTRQRWSVQRSPAGGFRGVFISARRISLYP